MINKNFAFYLLFGLLISPVLKGQDSFSKYEEKLPESEVSFTMVPVEGGTDNVKIGNEEVSLSMNSFWIGMHELTYDEYVSFMQDENFSQDQTVDAITRPSPPYIDFTLGMGKEGGFPANSMSLYGAMMYCKWLYEKTGHFYRPPSEAEWQWACQKGNTTVTDQTSVYKENSDNKYGKVGGKEANDLGLFDMIGNVAEWTIDSYYEDYKSMLEKEGNENPIFVPESKRSTIVLKGGHFRTPKEELSCSLRIPSEKKWNRRDPQIPKSKWWNTDAPFIGFRLVRPNVEMTDDEIHAFYDQFLN